LFNTHDVNEEIFGPILPVITYESEDDLINYVNARAKPLALYYFGLNENLRERIVMHTSSGGITINDCVFHALN